MSACGTSARETARASTAIRVPAETGAVDRAGRDHRRPYAAARPHAAHADRAGTHLPARIRAPAPHDPRHCRRVGLRRLWRVPAVARRAAVVAPQRHDGGARRARRDCVVDRPVGAGDQAEPWQLACPRSPDDRLDRRGDLRLGILGGRAWSRSPRNGRRWCRRAWPSSGRRHFVALYLHVREATHYGRRIVLALAGAATLVIGAVAWIISIGVDDGNVSRVDLGPDVRLEARRVVPNRDIADYLAEVDKLKLAAGRERQKSLLNAPLADADDRGRELRPQSRLNRCAASPAAPCRRRRTGTDPCCA